LPTLAKNWWPVLVWLGILRLESTDFASSANTSGLLYAVLSLVTQHINGRFVQEINEVVRKSGHFVGYGILGALVFYALRYTNRDWLAPLLPRSWGMCLHDFWRMDWAMLGVAMAVIAASLDEIHQSFLPSRTGQWQDVVLDTCGAVVLQFIIYFFSVRALNRNRKRVGQPEFSSIS
jgi:VanZ family protein